MICAIHRCRSGREAWPVEQTLLLCSLHPWHGTCARNAVEELGEHGGAGSRGLHFGPSRLKRSRAAVAVGPVGPLPVCTPSALRHVGLMLGNRNCDYGL